MQNVFTKIAKWSAALMGGIALTACSKVVSYVEEVEIDGKIHQVERKDFFEKRPIQLQWQDWWLGSEIYVKDSGLPRWRGELKPMYIGKANDGRLILVTLILGSENWEKRGRPSNWYVAFNLEKERWNETSVPPEFEGRLTSFMISSPKTGEKKLVTARDREFSNKINAQGRAGRIELNLPTQR